VNWLMHWLKSSASISQISQMNPHCRVNHLPDGLLKILMEEDPEESLVEFIKEYSVVCVADESIPITKLIPLDNVCRKMDIGLFVSAGCGLSGYFWANLHSHKMSVDGKLGTTIEFPSLEDLLTCPFSALAKKTDINFFVLLSLLRWSYERKSEVKTDFSITEQREECLLFVRSLLQDEKVSETISNAICQKLRNIIFDSFHIQCIPSAAIVGGILSQEVRKFITKEGSPLSNTVWFDGETCAAVYSRMPSVCRVVV